jgi:UPF0755 protein
MKKLAVLVVLLGLVGYGGSRAYDYYNVQVNVPVDARDETVVIKVSPGEDFDTLADELVAKHLIRSRDTFVLYARYTGARSRLQAGVVPLNRRMNMAEILDALTTARGAEQILITIPEGYTVKRTSALVEQQGLGKAADYLAAAQETGWTQDFLAKRPARPDLLEGYLYPETYSLDRQAKPRDLVKAQLDQFGKAFSPALRQQAAGSTPNRPAQTTDAIVIMASMVEREVNRDPDRARVCSVIYNRLSLNMPLQIDATVLYALGVWKKEVLFEDLKVDSPYNTYLHNGLPPGPISNPGSAAIKACLNPEKTDFLYYFTDPKGVTHFDRTLAEFERDKAAFGVSSG